MSIMNQSRKRHLAVAIIGAGFGGIGLGARLVGHGLHDFLIFDRAAGIGGTWWANRYPGCACDVPSHLYSLSFAPNPNWSRRFAPRAEIQAYLKRCVAQFGLESRLTLDNGIERAGWDDKNNIWQLIDDRGQPWTADIL